MDFSENGGSLCVRLVGQPDAPGAYYVLRGGCHCGSGQETSSSCVREREVGIAVDPPVSSRARSKSSQPAVLLRAESSTVVEAVTFPQVLKLKRTSTRTHLFECSTSESWPIMRSSLLALSRQHVLCCCLELHGRWRHDLGSSIKVEENVNTDTSPGVLDV